MHPVVGCFDHSKKGIVWEDTKGIRVSLRRGIYAEEGKNKFRVYIGA